MNIFQHPENQKNRQLPRAPQYKKLLDPALVTRGSEGSLCQCTLCRLGRTTLKYETEEMLSSTVFSSEDNIENDKEEAPVKKVC